MNEEKAAISPWTEDAISIFFYILCLWKSHPYVHWLIDSFVYGRWWWGLLSFLLFHFDSSPASTDHKQGINSGHAFSYVSRRKRDQAACLFYLFFPECAALIAFLFMLTYSRTRERAKRPSRHSPRLSIYPVKIYCKPWAHERRSTWLLLSEKRECVRLIHSRFNMRLSLTAEN